jgi:branched-chain amino acid transport system substrate-binding protein
MKVLGKLAVTGVALAIGIAAVGCGSSSKSGGSTNSTSSAPAKSNKPIVIGHVLGATGFMQFYDVPANEAARLAAQDINAKGGVLGGRPLEISNFNMKTDPPLGVAGVDEMLRSGASVLLAPGDLDTAAPALQQAESKKKVIFSVEGSDYRLGLFGKHVYAMGLASNVQGAAGAEWAYNEKNWKSAYALVDVTLAITKSAGQFFVERFSNLGGKVVGTDTFKNDDPSIGAQITKIKSANPQPDFIYLSSFIPGSAKAIKQIRDAGIDLPILCQISCGEGISWRKGVPNLSNFFYTNMGFTYGPGDPNKQIWDLAQRFQKATGKPMELSLDLAGYASVQLIAYALNKAGSTDSEKVNAALESANAVPTILGPISFTPQFHMPYNQPVRINEVEKGKDKFVTTLKPQKVNLTGKGLPSL